MPFWADLVEVTLRCIADDLGLHNFGVKFPQILGSKKKQSKNLVWLT